MSDLELFLKNHPDVKQVELVLIDPSGVARGKWAPAATLKKAFAEGVNFPLSLHGLDVWGNEVPDTGLHISSGDLDGFCRAVPTSLSAVSWGGVSGQSVTSASKADTAQVILQTHGPDGTPFLGCARTVLGAALNRLRDKGLTAVSAFELEFHLLKPHEDWRGPYPEIAGSDEAPDAQFMYGLDALAERQPVFADIRLAAQWANISVDTIVKEAGPGQYEVNLNHRADALRAADDVVLLTRIIKESARKNGLMATFMAKPFLDQPGNGMHVHSSLLNEQGINIFAGEAGSQLQRYAVGGLKSTMQELALVFVNTKNGFRRMAPGSYAPTRANWGNNNRSVALRLPAAPDGAKRVEHRVSGADANPYLVLAAILQGMLEGLENKVDPGAELIGNAYEESTANRGESLPRSQGEALEMFRNSDFAARALGPQMRNALVAIKQAEIDGFANEISPLEHRTFL